MNFRDRLYTFAKSHPVALVFLIEIFVIIVLAIFGFKITYDPDLITDWTAVDAVGTWVCGLIIPFAVVIVQKRIDDSERRTGEANAATIEEIKRIKNSQGDGSEQSATSVLTDQDVYNVICIRIVASTEDIAKELGVEVKDIERHLKTLYSQKRIMNLNGYGNLRKGVEGCRWKTK